MTMQTTTQEPLSRAMVAMSGGVDSAVAALLLRDSGYEVAGITLKLFNNEDLGEYDYQSQCCSTSDVEDARQVALGLGLPHYVFTFSQVFGREVIDRFCDAYIGGLTPNPCIDCNRYVKFEALQQRRRELGFDFVATGHYARRTFDEKSGRYLLKTGLDPSKDQSYVLYHLTQEHLAHMLFPLGELEKTQVRALAQKAGFGNAEKPDSQDICFVPSGGYPALIERRTGLSPEPGPIVNTKGELLGEHRGLVHYTVGQRKGLGIAADEPLYVASKNVEENTLVIGTKEEAGVMGVVASDLNLIAVTEIEQPLRVTVKTRYRQSPQPAQVVQTGSDSFEVVFDEPQIGCAPGQAAVLYLDDTVVGGGTITATLNSERGLE